MASISSTGLGSGLDINSIVTQMMSLERRPLNLVQQAKSGLDTKLSAIGGLQSRISSLHEAAKAFNTPGPYEPWSNIWSEKVATSSNAESLNASASAEAAEGRYGVQVNNLASRQTVVSEVFDSEMTGPKDATITIELGRWEATSDLSGFTPKSGSNPLVIDLSTIRSGEMASLYEIRDAINSAKAGVDATVINDASGYRMALSSTETGADNAFRVTVIDVTGDQAAASGSRLNYNAAQPTSRVMTRTQTAANAQATINGIPIQSASNTLDSSVLSGVADGLTLNLSRVTTEEVEVRVGADRSGIQKSIEAFVSAYNEVERYIGEQTDYNPNTKKGGALQGDPMVNSLRTRMRELMHWNYYKLEINGVSYTGLRDIGFSLTDKGTLSLDSSKLSDVIEHSLDHLRYFFAKDVGIKGNRGVAHKIFTLTDAMLDSEGMFANRTSSLKGQITQNERRQESMDRRLTQTEERMRRQYQALDATMSSLGGTSNYLMQQFSLLSGNSRNR